MRKLVATAGIVAAMLLPAPAGASEAAAIVRVTSCPPHYTGLVVQAWDPNNRYWVDVVWLCVPPLAP
jgi:hypothetical protein